MPLLTVFYSTRLHKFSRKKATTGSHDGPTPRVLVASGHPTAYGQTSHGSPPQARGGSAASIVSREQQRTRTRQFLRARATAYGRNSGPTKSDATCGAALNSSLFYNSEASSRAKSLKSMPKRDVNSGDFGKPGPWGKRRAQAESAILKSKQS